jgi:NADPH-dependent 2,4-dienoyl-CoA reductase/sulfur reductase-like enzyme
MNAKRIIVVGGSAAGPKAASRARRLDENAVIQYSRKHLIFRWLHADIHIILVVFLMTVTNCFFTGRVMRDSKFFWNAKKITTRVNTEVISIDRKKNVSGSPIY